MPERSLSSTTMRFGVILGITAVALVILGPFINGNFGVGDSWASTPQPWVTAPVGATVSTAYSLLVQLCVPFSAALVGASLVMRHNQGHQKTRGQGQMKRTDPGLPGN